MTSNVSLLPITILALILLASAPIIWNEIPLPSQVSAHPNYWPTNGWRSTSPEAQGMSSFHLQAMEAHIQQLAWGHLVRSVVIIRNGYIVWETYFDPAYGPDQQVNIFSCTKSVTSALVGGQLVRQDASAGTVVVVADHVEEFTAQDLTESLRQITLTVSRDDISRRVTLLWSKP